ncbi:hypothetical protein AB1Y20_002462 [Prymnesium parvum]|uniref:3-dehydroquinate dehydratase n=1 Tax=Prymnesium parvum TaxID=97485 RepID=A0AB34J953_PRYPA
MRAAVLLRLCRHLPRLGERRVSSRLHAARLTIGVAAGLSLGLGAAQLPSACDSTPPPPPPPPPAARVLCLHGINLNMFGKRDASTYGTATLQDIDDGLACLAEELHVSVECFQTNHEGKMCERIHEAHSDGTAAILINAGAWTHYSYGIRDALAILDIPIIEVHMSNIHAREDMSGSLGEKIRHHSVVSPLANGIVAGFGMQSYLLGLRAAVTLINNKDAVYTSPKKDARSPFGAKN